MRLKHVAGMLAVLFSCQTMAIDNVTDEAIEYCSEIHTVAIGLYRIAAKKDGSAIRVFELAKDDNELSSLVMAAISASQISERLGGPEKAGKKYTADMLKVCLKNFHQKEFMGAEISQHALLHYPRDENDPTYLKLKKAFEEQQEEK